MPLIGIAYALFAASLIPALEIRFVTTVSRVSKAAMDWRRSVVYLTISLLALMVFWAMQQKYPFLGDGYVRSSELDQGIVHGSGRIYIRLLLTVSTTFDLSGRDTYRIVSTLLGVPFIFLALCVAYATWNEPPFRSS